MASAVLLAALLVATAALLPGTHVGSASRPASHMTSHAEQRQQHTSNWAVLVSTSRYWLNYRHSANIMSVYRALKVTCPLSKTHCTRCTT
jgi:hypothetical protein